MVLKSRSAGIYSDAHLQWDTIRRIRSAYSNQVGASALANSRPLAIGDQEGKKFQRIAEDPCSSVWFSRFMTGCKRRMGQDWRPDRAISSQQMVHLLLMVESFIDQAQSRAERDRWIFAGTYFIICYVDSLRGSEGLLLDLEGLRSHFYTGSDLGYVVVALLGEVKGEHGERQHLLPTVDETTSGLQVRRWLRRTIATNYMHGRTTGPAFCDEQGKVLTMRDMNECFHEALGAVFARHPSLFLADIKTQQDIEDKYDVNRSFRRGSDSRAISMQVSGLDIDVVNRWAAKEKAGTCRPNHKMKHHYSDINLLLEPFLRYTKAM